VLTVTLGLLGALLYGAADFVGGYATKRLHTLVVTGFVALTGLIVMGAISLAMSDRWSVESAIYGGISGVTGLAAIGLLYACLARGPMSILSPTTAILSALVPMTWGFAMGEQLSPWAYPALALALIAVVLVGIVPDDNAARPSLSALLMAIGSGVLIGAFYILIDLAPDDSGITSLVANRMVQTVLVLAILVIFLPLRGTKALVKESGEGSPLPWKRLVWVMVAGGVFDALANVAVLVGLRVGEIAVVSVLTALYPAGTIALASILLHERIQRVQWVGLVLALVASGMLAV
jgi:drug/metabolite transporter (DMT)-like permease